MILVYFSASVLDRLNALLEPNGELSINERGVIDGNLVTIKPHPNFRYNMLHYPVFCIYKCIAFRKLILKIVLTTQLTVQAKFCLKGNTEPMNPYFVK